MNGRKHSEDSSERGDSYHKSTRLVFSNYKTASMGSLREVNNLDQAKKEKNKSIFFLKCS